MELGCSIDWLPTEIWVLTFPLADANLKLSRKRVCNGWFWTLRRMKPRTFCVALIETTKSRLAYDAEPDGPARTLSVFQTRLLRELFRFEWFRQGREFAIDVLEEQPLLACLGHGAL
jgi:hypothetical protein